MRPRIIKPTSPGPRPMTKGVLVVVEAAFVTLNSSKQAKHKINMHFKEFIL
jgi:hypothetical protein